MLGGVNRGGAEMLTLDVCRNASATEFEISLVAGSGGDLLPEFAKLDGFYFFERRLFTVLRHLWQVRKLVKSRGIQIVHAQQPPDAVYLYFATLGLPVKRVLSLQNFFLDNWYRWQARFIIPRMDAIFPVSNSMQEWFRVEEGIKITDKFQVLYNAVDANRLSPTREPGSRSLREELGIDLSAQLLGMVGNFFPDLRKDQLTVCKALKKVFIEFPNAHFVFCGKLYPGAEEYYQKCLAYCREHGFRERVHFLGQRRDVPDILRELDLFVFSTLKEGLPVAAIEALTLGVPMIASDIPPVLEAVGADRPEGPCAEIFRTGDADDLADKMIALLAHPERLKGLAEKARLQTPIRFSIEAHLATLNELYRKLLSGK